MKHPYARGLTAAVLISVLASPVHAAGNNINLSLFPADQSQFDTLIDELATAVAYNPISPAEPLGITGFEIGVSLTMVELDRSVWNNAVSDLGAPSSLPVPRLLARKGLPLGIDIGASYTSVPGSNVKIIGGEVRKALLEGSTATPAVAVLGHFSNLSGVNDLDLSTYGLDLGISKGFAMLTPYAGVGQVWYDGSEKAAALSLNARDTSETRSYVGLKIGFLPFMNMVAQADFATANSYTLRLNLGF